MYYNQYNYLKIITFVVDQRAIIVGQSWLLANLGFGSIHVCVCVVCVSFVCLS